MQEDILHVLGILGWPPSLIPRTSTGLRKGPRMSSEKPPLVCGSIGGRRGCSFLSALVAREHEPPRGSHCASEAVPVQPGAFCSVPPTHFSRPETHWSSLEGTRLSGHNESMKLRRLYNSEHLIELVAKKYRDDIVPFGYTFPGRAPANPHSLSESSSWRRRRTRR